jgi:hypothetical protein
MKSTVLVLRENFPFSQVRCKEQDSCTWYYAGRSSGIYIITTESMFYLTCDRYRWITHWLLRRGAT